MEGIGVTPHFVNVLLTILMPALLLYALFMIFRSGKPKRLWLLFLTMTPFKPSPGLTYLFPGVESPPDPSHSNAVPTEVDSRPPKELPDGARRKV